MPVNRIIIDYRTREVILGEEQPGSIVFRLSFGSSTVSGKSPMAIQITDTQKFTATIAPVDARGNPARIDGSPIWASSDETLLIITPSDDGLAADVAALGPLGAAQVQVEADADLGEGVRTLRGVLDVEVLAGEAVALEISASVPIEAL